MPSTSDDRPQSPSGALEKAQQQRAEEILFVAIKVFAEKGFAQADVQEIADQAGVGKGTIYRQFGNKECLFLATTRRAHRWLNEELEKVADEASTNLERLRCGMFVFVRFFDEHPEVVELLIQERAHFRGQHKPTFFAPDEQQRDRWAEVFRQLIREGVLRDLPVQQIEEVITTFVFGTMFLNYFAGRDKALVQQCEESFDVLFNGLLAPEK